MPATGSDAPATRLTAANAADAVHALAARLDGTERPAVVLDLAGVGYLPAAALTAVLALRARVRAAGGTLTLVNANPTIRRVLAVTRLDAVLDVRDDGSALAA